MNPNIVDSSAPLSTLLATRAKEGVFTRIIAFGSSNTERRSPGMHWFDLLEIAYKTTHGRIFACINSGRGGDTTVDLLERMERDCLHYLPDITLITIGGNDADPGRLVSTTQYRENLLTIIGKLRSIGCRPVLQTYYAPDNMKIECERMERFSERMDAIRSVSREAGVDLIDHLARWERLRARYYTIFERLMLDPMHLNEAGNLLLGLDLCRTFSLSIPEDRYYREALVTQALMDSACR